MPIKEKITYMFKI